MNEGPGQPRCRRGVRALLLAVLLLPAVGIAARSAGDATVPPDPAPSQQVGPVEVPQGLSAEAWAGIRDQMAAARYAAAAIPSAPDRVGAHNPGQDLLLQFDAQGARVESLRRSAPAGGGLAATPLRLQTLALVRGTQRRAVTAVRPVAEGPRIEYRHDGWTEWYVNRAEGVEHGYTLAAWPFDQAALACRHSGRTAPPSRSCRVAPQARIETPTPVEPLRIELAVTGMRASQAGEALRFTDDAGGSLHYGKLWVVDADGQTLPATLTALSEDRIEIAFDDSQAKYPVVVDPLLINEEQFVPNPGIDFSGTDYRTGESVALSGDTLLLGAPRAGGTGAVWAFVRQANGVWTPQARLVAADGAAGDRFGQSVALDGDTALIGAFNDSVDGNSGQGSAYVFVRTGTTWTVQQKLTVIDGAALDLFGSAVAVDGDTALVGAYEDDVGVNADQGSAYVFTRSGSLWTQQAQLTAGDGAAGDAFGIAVALEADTALVGAYLDSVGANAMQGSAYVFTRSGTAWVVQQKLTAPDGGSGDLFGNAVALDGDTALVGAFGDTVGGVEGRGSASVFTRAGTVWTQQAQLLGQGGAEGDLFGFAVALDGDTALVGAFNDDVVANADQGSALVFTRSGTVWTQQAQLLAGDGASGDQFGSAVALDGDIALVGANRDDVGGSLDQGSATVFTRAGTSWSAQVQLTAVDGANEDGFGVDVALDGDTALVGAFLDDVGANPGQGSAYVFVRTDNRWTLQARLIAADGTAVDRFGLSVALDGDTALVGAFLDDVGANADQGSAYVFTRSGSLWSQQAQLTAADGAALDQFGESVALDGDTALVGAANDRVGDNVRQGSAYVFTRTGSSWSQQAQLFAATGTADDEFGRAVALDGDRALIAAPSFNRSSVEQGAVYVFDRSGSNWSEQARITQSEVAQDDEFGGDVALDGDTALIGAEVHDVSGNANQGAAYVFVRGSNNGWAQQAKLIAEPGVASAIFGVSVALDGDAALVGAGFDDIGADNRAGATYLFTRAGTTWSQKAKLVAADGALDDRFGTAVALDGDTALISAPNDTIAAGFRGGSLHFFRIAADYGDAPLSSLRADDGALHYFDSSGPSLGALIDTETNGQPDGMASGDDLAGADDEEGVSFSSLPAGGSGSVTVTVSAPAGQAVLDGWIDFNADGDWLDSTERVFDGLVLTAGVHVLSIPISVSAVPGQSFARMRLSSGGIDAPTGAAGDGEVEDHAVTILGPDSDGDGIPNDWENANGLDPNNPNDAGLDPDGDGLSNLDEFETGTDPQNADSDGDGIDDGADAEPTAPSNACSGVDAVFENEVVLGGTVRQCAASGSVEVRSTINVQSDGRIEVFAPRTRVMPGFVLPNGAQLGVTADGAP